MEETKFYILIPVYNVEKYLDDCLKSILSQSYSNYEMILVNDGSKDNSGKICERYAAEDVRVHVIHKQNGGQLSARLAAIDFVRQKVEGNDTYCIFVDSDDELKEGALKTINRKIISSACDMLIYGYEKFNGNDICYTTREEKIEEKIINDRISLFREAIVEHCLNSLCRKAVRTEMLFFEVEESYKKVSMGEDLLQSLYIYNQNPRTLIISDILYRYRINPNSITHTFNLRRFTDELTTRYYTVKTMEKLEDIEENDFNRYLDKSLSVVEWDIRNILSKSPSRREALNNLRQLYRHQFIVEYCLKKISNRSSIWLRKFSKGQFKTLLILHKISIIKNTFKGSKKVD